MHCAYYYRFRYPKNTPLLKVRAKEHWSNCLRTSISHFMKDWISKGSAPSLQSLQDTWNQYWYEEPMAITYTKGQTRNDLGNEGWMTLCKFYNIATENQTYIAAVDLTYKLEITKGTSLTGTIDLLLHIDRPDISKNYLAIKLVDSDYNASDMVGHNDIEMTAWRRAIRKLIASNEDQYIVEPRLAYFVLNTKGKSLIETKRYNEQNEILDETVMAVAKSIQTANYYPHFGNWCNNCDYQPLCNGGRWVDDNPKDLSFTRRIR